MADEARNGLSPIILGKGQIQGFSRNCGMDFPILIIWMSPILIIGESGLSFHLFSSAELRLIIFAGIWRPSVVHLL